MSLPNPSMSFSPFAILTAEEMNDLVENDQALAAGTGFNTGAIPTSALANTSVTAAKVDFTTVGAYEVLYSNTISSTTDTISTGTISARQNLLIILSIIGTGTTSVALRFNGDSTALYAGRVSTNGAADAAATAQTALLLSSPTTDAQKYIIANVINLSAREKIVNASASTNVNGAANAPNRQERMMKWANTSAQITSIDIINLDSGDFLSGSSVLVMGRN